MHKHSFAPSWRTIIRIAHQHSFAVQMRLDVIATIVIVLIETSGLPFTTFCPGLRTISVLPLSMSSAVSSVSSRP